MNEDSFDEMVKPLRRTFEGIIEELRKDDAKLGHRGWVAFSGGGARGIAIFDSKDISDEFRDGKRALRLAMDEKTLDEILVSDH